MALHMRQELRMTQQLVITPQLQQAIKLLQLSRVDLVDLVRNELMENPLLEEARELGSGLEDPVSTVELQDGVESQLGGLGPEMEGLGEVAKAPGDNDGENTPSNVDGFDWDAYLQQQSMSGTLPASGRGDDELPGVEATLTRPETLAEHLTWQIRLSGFSELDEEIAEYIVGCLGPAGTLVGVTVPQVARHFATSVLRVEQVLRKIQQLDPYAIAARSLAESLWLQLDHPEHPIEDPLVRAIVARHLGNLERRAYPVIARDCGELVEEVYEAVKVITHLDPRPARAFVGEDPQYIVPDVYIQKIGDDYLVTLNDDGLPRLKIAPYYQRALEVKGEARDYVTERLRSAQWLIRSIQQRQRTIVKVANSILKFQREFFDRGPEYLRPLILKDVAEDIEMHESTVSRVTTNKYVHTPQGIFELKYFFNAAISRYDGEDLASAAVKSKIKALLDSEDERRPHSDQRLVELLAEDGIDIARRTVAKYREQLGVLSSSKRRKLF